MGTAIAWVLALLLYSAVQAAILVGQDSRLGARFFLPRSLQDRLSLAAHETWDYHPVLPAASSTDLEASLTDPESALNAKEDCPICLSPVQIVPSKEQEADGTMTRDKLRWTYMVPPCHHIGHTECLERWLEARAQCPVCRARMPPL